MDERDLKDVPRGVSPSNFGVRHPVPANLLMIAIIGAGIVFGTTLRREMFPEIRADRASVFIPYPGASPQEIEDGVVLKVEDRLADLDEVDELTTLVTEGAASIMVTFRRDIDDIDKAVDEIERAIDTIDDLPEDSERITTTKFEAILPVIAVSLYGDVDEETMKQAARSMQDDMKTLPGMGDVMLTGTRRDEISVEVRPETLIQYGISLPQLSGTIRDWMREVPGGTVRTDSGTIRVRTMGVDERATEIGDIVVKSDSEGNVVTLGDIAVVRERFEDVDLHQRMNGAPSVRLTAMNIGEGDVVEIAELVRAYVAGRTGEEFDASLRDRINAIMNKMMADGYAKKKAKYEKKIADGKPASLAAPPPEMKTPRQEAYELGAAHAPLPDTVGLTLHNDLARFVEGRLDLLTRNAKWGALLVFLTLLIFLNLRVALWVMVGLVVSLLGTLAFMALVGITLNLLTMFGLIIVLGLLVDDAIVVAENITARHEAGEPPLAAAVNGATQIAWPVVATVSTTICAFFPLAMVEGQIGDFLGALPIVVACALIVSVIESLMILPAHMGHSLLKSEKKKTRNRFTSIMLTYEHWRDDLLQDRVMPAFGRVLNAMLKYRYVTTAVAVGMFIVSIGLIAGGRTEFTFFSGTDSEIIIVDLRMPVGTPITKTDAMIQKIEAVAIEQEDVQSVEALVGIRLDTNDWNATDASTHIAQLYIELAVIEERNRTSGQIITAIRDGVGDLPGVTSIRYEEMQGGPGGPDLYLVITGEDESQIQRASEALKMRLTEYDGVADIDDDADAGQRELQIRLRPGGAALGLTAGDVAQQIRGAVYGLEPHSFAADREDVEVRVWLDEETRRSLSRIEQLSIATPSGEWVPLTEVADLMEETSYSSIHRLNRERAVTVTADVDEEVNNPERIVAELQPTFEEIELAVGGVDIEARGRQIEVNKSLGSLRLGFLTAITLIYVILAWLFSSYTQPIAVLLAIPFAMIGMIWGHYLLGYKIMILSLIGFVALTGIVVNDSLILIEFYNHERARGVAMRPALVTAGMRRLRPIMLTTVTTVLGLLPIMLEQSFQARILIPMGISISGGLISATGLILIVLPCLMLIGHDIERVGILLWRGEWIEDKTHGEEEEATTA